MCEPKHKVAEVDYYQPETTLVVFGSVHSISVLE